jgi:flagellin
MAVSENVRAQLGGFQRAARNINDTVSMANTAESGYQAISDILVKMKQIAVESASDAVTDTERGFLDTEFTAMADEIDRLVETMEFNGNTLLNGTAGSAGNGSVTVQAGMRNSADDQLELTLNAVDSTTLGVNAAQTNVTDLTSAQTAVGDIDAAMESLNTSRMNIGSFINRADIASNSVQASVEQFSLGLGNARDASIAEESAGFNKEQVLQQAGVSMLSQANAQANIALRLIG